MPLKKPSDFFKKEETSLDSIKGEMDVSSPDKIERVSEAFTAFRSNLNHIQSLTDFSDTFDGFKDNVDKVCLLYTSPSPRDRQKSRMPSSA